MIFLECVANTISGLYKPHEYGLVILPMAVVKRFHDCLVKTQAKVLKVAEEKGALAMKDAFLREASGYAFYNTGIATYVWISAKSKPKNRRGKVQLIDASGCCEARRKPIGNKRYDITDAARALIVKAYCEFRDETYESSADCGGRGATALPCCVSSVGSAPRADRDDATVGSAPRADRDDATVGSAPRADRPGLVVKSRIFDGAAFGYTKVTVVTKDGKDTENVPLGEDIDAYMAREVLPYSPTAKVDPKKSKVGYEIPFTRTFYEYKPIEPADAIKKRIEEREKHLMADLKELFGENETTGTTGTHGTTETETASQLAERRVGAQPPCRRSRGGRGGLVIALPKKGGR